MSKQRKIQYAWIILIAVSLIRGISGPGINASSGLFLTPVSEELGVGIGRLSLYLSISSVVTLIWLPVAGNLLNRFHVKTCAVLSVLLQTGAFFALSYVSSVYGFYILAVPLAMGGALLVNLLGPVLLNRWFESNIGLVMGLMMTITSLSGAIFQPLLTSLIVTEGWRMTYIIFGAGAFGILLILILVFLRNHPEDMDLNPWRSAAEHEAQCTEIFSAAGKSAKVDGCTISIPGDPQVAVSRINGVTAKSALHSPSFYMLLLFMIVLTAFAAFSQHLTTFGLGHGIPIQSIGTALSYSLIGSAVGSILIGFFSDRAGIIPASLCVMIVALTATFLFFFGNGNQMLFITAAFLHGLASASIGVMAPLLTRDYFGVREYEKLYSYVMMGAPFASIVLLPLYGFIYDIFGSYQFVLIFLAAALVIGSVSVCVGKKSSKRLQ